ncbi:MAG: FTR1 family protein [Thermoplasmata archaeon]|nr:FTR1 family protein [Thermoplasmata archaeon]
MIESFVIALREGIEAALIVGIILGYLKKVGAETLAKPIYYGVGLGVLASIGAAGLFLLLRVEFAGRYEQLFEGITMLVAAVILTTMILWMRNNSKTYSEDLREKVETALTKRQSYGLASLAFVSIWREGIETVLFLGSASFTSSGIQLLIGGGLGLGLSVLIGVAIMKYSVRLDLRTFFNVTGILLIMFAAGLVGRSILEFQEAGVIAPMIEHVYDINWLIDGQSTAGKLLTALLGYDASPSLAEIFGYIGYWVLISFWMYRDTLSRLFERVIKSFRPA